MYQPTTGTGLVVSLPGETVRSIVARVVSRDTVLVELQSPLLNPARMHNYRVGDIVCCKRAHGELGELWEAIDERRLPPAPELKPKKMARKKPAPKKPANARRKISAASFKKKRRAVGR
jgi:hypothetical protein